MKKIILIILLLLIGLPVAALLVAVIGYGYEYLVGEGIRYEIKQRER